MAHETVKMLYYRATSGFLNLCFIFPFFFRSKWLIQATILEIGPMLSESTSAHNVTRRGSSACVNVRP